MSLNEMAREVNDWAHSKGWWDEPREGGTVIALMHSELSEALEEMRNGHSPGEVRYEVPQKILLKLAILAMDPDVPEALIESGDAESRAGNEARATYLYEKARRWQSVQAEYDAARPKPEGVGVELVDCIIRILDYAGEVGIDLDGIYRTKQDYNGTREVRHGGKAF